jgi:nucleoid DNA-binding protein
VKNIQTAELPEPYRVNKREFMKMVARRTDLPYATTERVYDALIASLLDVVRDGAQLNLTGFGKFYRLRHAGHPSQLAKTGRVRDYTVLKFTATHKSNLFLDLNDRAAHENPVPGAYRNGVRR